MELEISMMVKVFLIKIQLVFMFIHREKQLHLLALKQVHTEIWMSQKHI